MRIDARRGLAVGGAVLLAAALGITVSMGMRRPTAAERVTRGPLAVVLLPGVEDSTLAVVDLEAGAVVRRVGLRSLATDIALDASSGLVVGAQAGGLGRAADRAASLIDAHTGAVRYVELPATDPGDVACVEGRAFLLHSTREQEGAVFSVIDVASARVVASGHAPGPPGLWASAGGAVWTSGERGSGAPVLRRIDPRTLAISDHDAGGLVPMGIAEAGGRALCLGIAPGRSAASGGVATLAADGGSVEASGPVTGLAQAPRRAASAGDRLVVGDWSGDEPEGRALAVLDTGTLRMTGRIVIDGVPCALAAWRDRLLVVDRLRGRLLVVDPASGRTVSTVELGVADLVFSDVVVVPG